MTIKAMGDALISTRAGGDAEEDERCGSEQGR